MLQPEVHDAVPPAAPVSGGVSARSDVAVVGAGASGTLTAIHLMASRSHDLTVTLHDASGELGKGLAYGTTDRRHLLNVRSRHMSAFPDIPGDLVEWARRTGRERDAQAFLPRRDYAVYLGETLDRLRDERLSFRAERVLDVVPADGGFELHGSGGRVDPGGHGGAGARQPAPGAADRRRRTAAGGALAPARPVGPRPADRARAGRRGRPRRHRADRGRRRDHAAGRRPRPAGGDGEPARAAAHRPHRAELHRLAEPGPDRAGHRRPARRPPARPDRGGPASGCRLAPCRRRAPGTDPGALAAARPRRAAPVPRVVRPRVGGTPAPDGHRGRSPAGRLPRRGAADGARGRRWRA